MTKHEIIDLIASTYNCQNRAEDGHACFYLTGDGKTCAVGMTLEDPEKWEDFSRTCADSAVETVFESDEILWAAQKEKFRGHSLSFWANMQHFHDRGEIWTDTGLSGIGKQYVNQLKDDYDN